MGDGVNTNVEALHEIKNSLVRFQERIQPLQGDLRQAFQEIDEQLADIVDVTVFRFFWKCIIIFMVLNNGKKP